LAARRHGLDLALHPHHGTVIENAAHVDRVLAGSRVELCLDLGHLAVAGADALAVARRANGRVGHVHLKDVDAALADRVRKGEIGYHAAVRAGLYRPLGQGGSRIRETVSHLEASGYSGWYVLEQDVVLEAEPEAGSGPVGDVARSLAFLQGLLA
jgi:inosose dehydratase